MNVMTRPVAAAAGHDLAGALAAGRAEATEAIAAAFEQMPRWRALAESQRGARAEHVALHFGAFVDYLKESFGRDDATFRHLFVGELIKALYSPELDDEAARTQTRSVLTALRERLVAALAGRLSRDARAALEADLAGVEAMLTRDVAKTQRVLLVGDCLYLDLVPFIYAELLEHGIALRPDYVASKHPEQLREQLRGLAAKKFDLVFFSPFSYEFAPDYARLADWRQALTRDDEIRQVVDAVWAETEKTVELLADLFDCPIHVHNSAAVVREESAAKRVVKQKATAKARGAAKRLVNERMPALLARKNAETFQHLFLFDEDRIVGEVGEMEAGAFFYKTALQHPAALGRILAPHYREIVFVNAWLAKRKVVVCDLDNTLWDGVIGEGAVEHFHDRQQVLKALKQKGVVLAINSKNDPANVHWRGGTLGDDDFVFSAISWNAKVEGMRRIQAGLNLKIKDYVFIDDREDERELMRLTYPDVLCMDATDPRTWSRLALWERTLEPDPDMDRTLMYKQREERKAFIQEDVVVPESERAALFGNLGLKLTIVRAQPADLKRAAELINRTNQFNLEGSRTSVREVREWHESPDHVILLGQTADRFGDMGTTCVAVARVADGEMDLLPFVLSCRVFGYGIEYGVMAELRRLARARGADRIVGRYVATPQNTPCAAFLAESGLVEAEAGVWRGPIDAPGREAPGWLQVVVAD